MARVPMVTRTITSTQVELMCVDKERGEIFNDSIIMPRTYKDETKLLKAVEKVYNKEGVKVVDIVDTKVVTAKYGMTEQKFVETAELMPDKDDAE